MINIAGVDIASLSKGSDSEDYQQVPSHGLISPAVEDKLLTPASQRSKVNLGLVPRQGADDRLNVVSEAKFEETK